MGLLAGVPSHVHDEHVHGLEGFFLAGAVLPAAYEDLLVFLYVIFGNVLDEMLLMSEL